METPALHVGVIGVGRIGVFHVQTLQAVQGVSRLTVADADADRALRVARELGVDAAETPEALVRAGVDALVIATATPGHAPLLQLAAAAGLPAFCEKPVALELAALDDVLAEVDRAGILVQIGFQRRFDAGYRAAHDAVAAGALGNLLVVRAATPATATPWTASSLPTATSSRRSSPPFEAAARALAPSARRAPRSSPRSPPIAPAPSGARSRSRRWLA